MVKPDVELRKHPLEKVVAVSKEVTGRILFHKDQLCHEIDRRRCFCKTKSNGKMTLCEGCDEWYHHVCLGVTEEEARDLHDWRCGYCLDTAPEHGLCEWKSQIGQEKRKRPRVAPKRHISDTPRARGVQPFGMEHVMVGPSSWDEIVALAKGEGKKINLAEKRRMAKVAKLVKEGGHHVVDVVGAEGVEARAVDPTLADELLHLGLLDGEEGEEEEGEA